MSADAAAKTAAPTQRVGETTHGALRCFLLVFACFALVSLGYLSWLYRLMALVPAQTADILSMVCGYLLQAAGLAAFALAVRRNPAFANRTVAIVATVAFVAFTAPAMLGTSLAGVLVFGLAMNFTCGIVSGFYLHELAHSVPQERRGTVFGGGYAAASVLGWLLSMPESGSFLRAGHAMTLYVAIGVAAVALFALRPPTRVQPAGEGSGKGNGTTFPAGAGAPACTRSAVWLAFGTVVALSLVKNLGFDFPSTDVESGMSLELSRVFYAVGLVAAGIVCDRSRRYGALCCLAALVVPFIMLALSGEPVSSMVFWCLGYLFFGFFSVYRVVLFCDLASTNGLAWIAALGLVAGRAGDALGTALFTGIGPGRTTLLVLVTAILFAATVFLFFRLYQRLYAPVLAAPVKSEREVFEDFAATYSLSAREREVLRGVLEERGNADLAASLFVSESTVKFHIHNLLKKTGCKNRLELLALYASRR